MSLTTLYCVAFSHGPQFPFCRARCCPHMPRKLFLAVGTGKRLWKISPKHPYLVSSPSSLPPPLPSPHACPLTELHPFLQAQTHMVYTAEPGSAQPNLHAYLAASHHACLLPAQPLAQAPSLPPAHYAQQLCHTPNISQLTQGPAHVPPLMYHSVCTGNPSYPTPAPNALSPKECAACAAHGLCVIHYLSTQVQVSSVTDPVIPKGMTTCWLLYCT